jgi:hypothetical protein
MALLVAILGTRLVDEYAIPSLVYDSSMWRVTVVIVINTEIMN